jgi:hypothetical protein
MVPKGYNGSMAASDRRFPRSLRQWQGTYVEPDCNGSMRKHLFHEGGCMAKSDRDPGPRISPTGKLMLDLWEITERTAAAVGTEYEEREFLPHYRAVLQAQHHGFGRKDEGMAAREFERLVGRPFDITRDAITWAEADALPLKRVPVPKTRRQPKFSPN